jgi:hypothetical protein
LLKNYTTALDVVKGIELQLKRNWKFLIDELVLSILLNYITQ